MKKLIDKFVIPRAFFQTDVLLSAHKCRMKKKKRKKSRKVEA